MRLPHQSLLAPAENKFHVGNGEDGKHYWLVPPTIYNPLHAEFNFDFDPCPFPLPQGFDGLTCDWGSSNWVNPPFGSILRWPHNRCDHVTTSPKSKTCVRCGAVGKKLGPTAWVRKAITEHKKGKTCVLVYPVDKWVLMITKELLGDNAQIRNLGDVKWLATEDGSAGKGTGRHIACFVFKAA